MGAEFVRGRVCQGPSLLGAEMSRNPVWHTVLGIHWYREVRIETIRILRKIMWIEFVLGLQGIQPGVFCILSSTRTAGEF